MLLIACANVAGLTIGRIAGQLLTESLLLSIAGAGAGALLALWGARLLGPADLGLPGVRPIEVDAAVLAFCAAVAIATGVAFGLLPALQASRPVLNAVLRDAGRVAVGGRRRGASSSRDRSRSPSCADRRRSAGRKPGGAWRACGPGSTRNTR